MTDELESDEPAWMVIAPLDLATIEPVINAVIVGDGWQLVEGSGDHIAIVGEPELRGVEDRLAEDLSKLTDKPVYVLVFDEEDPRVDAFVDGAEAGVVAANLYDVAHVLGVGLDERDPAESITIDLTPHKMPDAGEDEPLVLGKTLAQWQHLMAFELNWDLAVEAILDEAIDAGIEDMSGFGDEVLPLLDDADPAVRVVGIRLAGNLGDDGFADLEGVIDKLRKMARSDHGLREDIDEAIDLLSDGGEAS